jgi:hypothetical protein
MIRRLHPVGPRERFVQSGTYRRLSDNKVVEKWTLHEMDGALLARVDCDSFSGFTLYEALFDPEGMPIRFNMEQFEPHAPRTRVHRMLIDGRLQTTLSRNTEAETSEVVLPLNVVPMEWPWILRGLAVHAAARLGWMRVFPVWEGGIWPVVLGAVSEEVRAVQVGSQRLWISARGITIAVHDAEDRYYLDDRNSKGKAYASVE